MFEQSGSENGILRSETYLSPDHVPEKPVGRESEIRRIADAIRPLTKKRTPDNLLVYGPAGVGKTTSVKHTFQRLDEETRVKTVYVNCWKYNTRPSLLTELLIQLGYPAPRKGKPVDELLSKIGEWLNKNRGFAVALDEFDQLDEKTEVIYDLQMLNADSENKLGTVMVSNQHPRTLNLDPRSQSRLNCQTLEYQPYTAPQLQQILEKRVEQAFRPGTVPDEAVEMIAEDVAEKDGDCRKAMNLLLRTGRRADQKGERKISDKTVNKVLQS